MMSLRNLWRYFVSSLKRATKMEQANFFCNIACIAFYSMVGCRGAWYLLAIIIAADTFRLFVRGAWYYAPFHETAHYWNPSKDDLAIVAAGAKFLSLIVLVIAKLPEFIFKDLAEQLQGLRSILWYIIVIAAVTEMFRCLLYTMHKYNEDWLHGTEGEIGLPNWISILRISISIIMPHIYVAQPFGAKSNYIATGVMIIAISTDAIDGLIARATHSITKVGKYLDPLGDKVIFFPNAVAFIWLLYQSSIMTGSKVMMIITTVFITITVARDVLFFVWFFKRGRKIPDGIGASLVDKVRMGCICAWLLAMTISITVPDPSISLQMTVLSIILIIATALLSAVSVYVDYRRLETALKKT
jgi:phosphatidylglycerophosphate synthase